jgi:hypothetical protein
MESVVDLKSGDHLQIAVGDVATGTFAVSDLPNHDATLVLVVYRHDGPSTAVAFESHVFAKLVNSQIAVLDAYRGEAKASPQIQDDDEAKTSRAEELRYDSVVAVNPGQYEVVLVGSDGESSASEELVALNRESYLVVRCGAEGQDGDESFPQSLLVFPRSDPKMLTGDDRSVAAGRQVTLSMLLAAVWLFL